MSVNSADTASGAAVSFPQLQTEYDTSLDQLDFNILREERFKRNNTFLKSVNPIIAAEFLPKIEKNISAEERAVVTIQRYFRGYLARKRYVDLLFEQFEREEKEQNLKKVKQVEEGELLVENHWLEVLIDDDKTTRHNRDRLLRSHVIVIQRAWRAYIDSKKASLDTDLKSSAGKKVENSNSPISTDKSLDAVSNVDVTQNEGNASIDKNVHVALNTEIVETLYCCPTVTSDEIAKFATYFEKQNVPALNFAEKQYSCEANTVPSFSIYPKEIASDFIVNNICIQGDRKLDCGILQRKFDKSDKDYQLRQQRKQNLLCKAQEFADLKKSNKHAKPLDLFMSTQLQSPDSKAADSSDMESENQLSEEMKHHTVKRMTSGGCDENENMKLVTADTFLDSGTHGEMSDATNANFPFNPKLCIHTNIPSASDDKMQENLPNQQQEDNFTNIMNKAFDDTSDTAKNLAEKLKSPRKGCGPKRDNSTEGADNSDCFDVYNIESTVPHLDWATIERRLQEAAEEEKKRQKARRNDREEIRKKLAFGTDDDFYSTNDKVYKKNTLQSRLQGGMNLQICFLNDPVSGDQDPEAGGSPQGVSTSTTSVDRDNNHTMSSDIVVDSKRKLYEEAKHEDEGEEDFFKRQARLQHEAKLALAQAGTMAHMQLEVEKQMQKKSPVADMVGIPLLADARKKRLSLRKMQDMNLAQIQVLYNDLHTQIENLNEELVKLLMERDELHMEQDSMLVDVEDLTRRAEELAKQVNTTSKKPQQKSVQGR
ncbi:hypothetical protein CHS0354_032775 [Potamilus streckersoni]|uniref:Schwannomin-interacting protein 1 n=1 Tax=Potamilus streckersoni TaxID=2493646 RepID=A0AAE0W3M0_9BIVA|nr:hypothetical protein CHS0354_032775 [Potamilus streckersoni]